MKSLYIGVDFDGTVVHHKYPDIGEPVENCLEVLEDLQNLGHKLILITMRSEERLVDAVEYLEENGIKLLLIFHNWVNLQSQKILFSILKFYLIVW